MNTLDLYYGSLALLVMFGAIMLLVAIGCFAMQIYSEHKEDAAKAAAVSTEPPQATGEAVTKLSSLDEYHKALYRLEFLLSVPIPETSPEHHEIMRLASLVEAYEEEHFSFWYRGDPHI